MYAYIIHPVAALVLAWVIDRPVQAISLLHISCNMGIWALPDMYALYPRASGPQTVGHTYQAKPSCLITTITC